MKAIALCALATLAAAQAPEPRPDVAGVTLDAKGQPLRKVNLTLLPLATNPGGEPLPPYGATSETDGKFAFYGVAPGRYRLMGERAGYLKSYPGARNSWSTGAILNLRQGVPLTGVEIRMTEQSVISGKVLQDGGASYVFVSLLQQRYEGGQRRMTSIASANADASGEFSFNKLARGRYYLAAFQAVAQPETAPGLPQERYLTTYYPATFEASAAEPIELKRGETVDGLTIPLRKSRVFRVSGTVAGFASGSDRVLVTLRSAMVAEFTSGYAGALTDGTFRFDSVSPGSYRVTAVSMGNSSTILASQTIEVSQDIVGLVLQADPLPELRGTVKVEGGPSAIPNLRVRLAPAGSFGMSTPTATVTGDGSFTLLGVAAGRYRVETANLPAGAFLKSASLGEKDALGGLDFARGAGDAKLSIVISYAGARVAGTVRDGEGRPVDGIVTLIPEPPQPEQASLYQMVETSENGRFQLQGIRPGKYRLYAWEELEPGSHLDPKVTAPCEAFSVAVVAVESGGKTVDVKRITVDQMEAAAKPPAP